MKILEGYGYRVQKSVFECEVTRQHYDKMSGRISKVVKREEDSVRFYFLCQKCISSIRICALGEALFHCLAYPVALQGCSEYNIVQNTVLWGVISAVKLEVLGKQL